MKRIILLLSFIVSITAGAVVAADFVLPFGLTAAPGSTLAISDKYDSGSGDREEAIARFATKDTREVAITYYRQALESAGFEIYSASDTEKHAMIAGKRGDDRVTVTYKESSDWVEENESELAIKAVYKK